MEGVKKIIVLKEQPSKIHREKLLDIIKEAELVGKQYVLRQWPGIWPKLQVNLDKQDIRTLKAVKIELKDNKITDVQPKHLDLTNFLQLIQNAKDSPICSQPASSLYHNTWINSKDDIKDKVKLLQEKLRVNVKGKLKLESEEDLLENDITEILTQSDKEDKIINVNSYLWLINEDRPHDGLLSAHYKQNGVKSCLSVLKLAFPTFNWNEYAFVVYMSILRLKRNTIHSVTNEFIPLASYNKDYHVINECIQNIFALMINSCNGNDNATKEVEDFRCEIQNRIENILCRTSYEAEISTVFETVDDTNPASSWVTVKQPEEERMSRSVSAEYPSVVSKTGGAITLTNDTINNENLSLQDNGTYCKDCGISVSSPTEMKAHFDGKPHKKKVAAAGGAMPSSSLLSTGSSTEAVPLTKEERETRAVQLTLNNFIETFDPIPIPCAFLRGKHVLSVSEVEKIRSQPSPEERAVEFLEILQQKHDWFNYLKSVLEPKYKNLLQQLEYNYNLTR